MDLIKDMNLSESDFYTYNHINASLAGRVKNNESDN